jgi:uncharacterized protein (UPF0262 family)
MPNDVKNLLDSIIDDTNNSYPAGGKGPVYDKETVGAYNTHNNFHPQTFDKGKFREKLSLYVLHDLVGAMMHDETTDLDNMIDESIMRHIKNNYNGSCYSYLTNARDRLKSPLLADVIQEVDTKTDEVEEELEETKDEDTLNFEINIKDLLKDVVDYDDFREKLKDQVSKKVVDDVAGVITQRNDAPIFPDLDEKLNKQDADEVADEEKAAEEGVTGEDHTTESVILKLTGAIVTEAAINKVSMSTEEGMNRAVVEYCLNEMDYLFKADPKVNMYARYRI